MSKKGIKHWVSENKNAVFVGLASSFAWQIILFIMDVLPNVGSNVFETIENFLYSSSATMSIDRMISILFSMFMGGILGIGAFKIIDFIISKVKLIKSKIFANRESNKSESEKTKDIINNCLNALSVLSIMIAIILGFNMVSFRIRILFDLDMASIKPYITNEQYDILISDWTQMKSKKDYKEIYNIIKKAQEKNNLSSAKKNLK